MRMRKMVTPCPEIVTGWWNWYPYVGTFIGILAGVGVIVPWLRGDKAYSREKLFWSMVMVMLVLLELRSIRLDARQHESEQALARCRELQNFGQIGDQINASIDVSQQQFEATVQGLKETLQATQQAIQNTTPFANVQFVGITGRLHPDGTVAPVTVYSGTPVKVNVFYRNTGTAVATDVQISFRFYVGKPDDLKTQQSIRKIFDHEWQRFAHKFDALAPNDPNPFATFSQTFSEDDLKAIRGGETVYVLFRAEYSDGTGRWTSDRCAGFQEPLIDLSVTHPCVGLKQNRRKIGTK